MDVSPVIAAKIERLRGLINYLEWVDSKISPQLRNDIAKELDSVIGDLKLHVDLAKSTYGAPP